MISLIDGLFRSYDLIPTEIDNGKLFAFKESSGRMAFWLVVHESDLVSLVERQPQLFEACKQVCQDDALDKNISMLVLWDTGGKLEIGEMKKRIMSVEEDPYFFKKYVLYYSTTELNSLRTAMQKQSLSDFLMTQIISQETFAQYKKDPIEQKSWQPLLYRIAIKVPFVEINIEASGDLEALFEENKEKVKDESLSDFNNQFFEGLDSITVSTIKTMEAVELLAAFGGTFDGN